MSLLERVPGWHWLCSGQSQAWQLPTVQPTIGSGGRHAPTGGGAAVPQQMQVDQLLQLRQKDACAGQIYHSIGNHCAMVCSCLHFPPQAAAAALSLPLQRHWFRPTTSTGFTLLHQSGSCCQPPPLWTPEWRWTPEWLLGGGGGYIMATGSSMSLHVIGISCMRYRLWFQNSRQISTSLSKLVVLLPTFLLWFTG